MVKVAYFDNYVDEDFFKKITDMKINKTTLCYSNDIRLRKFRNSIFTFHRNDWRMSGIEPSFGVVYELDVKDLDIFKMYHSPDTKLEGIKVTEIEVSSVDEFMENKYKIIEHGVTCLCFVASRNSKNETAYKNRRNKIRFNIKLLVNLLKI